MVIRLLFVLALLASVGLSPSPPDRLPESSVLLRTVREDLLGAMDVLRQYTFLQRSERHERAEDGTSRVVRQRLYEVSPDPFEGLRYKLIERDGTRLTADELARRDREYRQELADERRRRREFPKTVAKERAKDERETRDLIDEAFRLLRVEVVAREVLDGERVLRVEFEPRPGEEADSRIGAILAKSRGRAWITEGDYQIVRMEFEAVETVSYGFGLIGRLHKGARAVFEQQRVGGRWLPARYELTGTGRVLLVKSVRMDSVTRFYDYRRAAPPPVATSSR